MAKFDTLLNERIGSGELSKVKALAKQSSEGGLSGFSGLFKIGELSQSEKYALQAILEEYKQNVIDIQKDLQSIVIITSEVKAIHNQAALLHGERIKRVQTILKEYREGAFTAWLYAAYGNRQTPYNFLLYYEFCQALPQELRSKVDEMPRQAIYSLASRQAPLEKKLGFIHQYNGQTKQETLQLLRSSFPLEKADRRKSDEGEAILKAIIMLTSTLKRHQNDIPPDRRKAIAKAAKRLIALCE